MASKKEITIESYNATAEQYAANVAKLFLEQEAGKFLSYLEKGSLILDAGCGSGRDARVFTERGYRVIGIDLSEKLLEIAKKNAPNAEFKLMDIADVDFSDESFNGIWNVASLLHVPKEEAPNVIGGFYRTLKKGGLLYISVKEGEGETVAKDTRYGGVEKFWSFFHKEELESLLKDFMIVESTVTYPGNNYNTNPWVNVLCKKIGGQNGKI